MPFLTATSKSNYKTWIIIIFLICMNKQFVKVMYNIIADEMSVTTF